MSTVRSYTAGDILAQLLAGNHAYAIAYAYLVFDNSGTPVPLVPSQSDTVATFHALSGTQDILRVPVLQNPAMSATGVNYNSNRATFTIIGNGSVGVISGLPFSAVAGSQVTNIALVAAPTGVYTGDVLYSHTDLATALPVLASGHVGATYSVEVY